MNRLIFQAGALEVLRRALLASTNETAAVLLATPCRGPSGAWRLVVDQIAHAPADAYLERSGVGIALSPGFLAPLIKRARYTKASIVLVHTHPWPGPVQASPVDLAGESALLPTLYGRVPGVPHARLIFGHQGHDAALFLDGAEPSPIRVQDAGPSIVSLDHASEPERLTSTFDRQVRAFGVAGQRILEGLRVGIVGLGGTGSVVVQQLAHLGVRDFLLIDPDTIDDTNLNRVVGSTPSDIGRKKGEVAAALVRRIRSDGNVQVVSDSVLKASVARALLDVDVFFCCTDSHGSRAVLNQLSYQYGLPAFDIGVRIESAGGLVTHITGRVQMLAPSLPCLICAQVLDSEQVRRDLLTEDQRRADPYITGSVQPQPAVVSINSTMASLAVNMYIGAATGIPFRARHQIARLESGEVRAVSVERNPRCVVCSEAGVLGRGDSWPSPGSLA